MIFDVQNGTVQSKKSPICIGSDRTWKAKKYATVKPMSKQQAQVMPVNISVFIYTDNVTGELSKNS